MTRFIAVEILKDTPERSTVKIPKHQVRSCFAGKPRPRPLYSSEEFRNVLYKKPLCEVSAGPKSNGHARDHAPTCTKCFPSTLRRWGLKIHDGLVWTVGLNVERKLRFPPGPK